MLGYMNEKQAKEYGFTHYGKYYGIPIWMAPEKGMMIATKWTPLEYLMTVFHYIEGFMDAILYPDTEPSFMFKIMGEID